MKKIIIGILIGFLITSIVESFSFETLRYKTKVRMREELFWKSKKIDSMEIENQVKTEFIDLMAKKDSIQSV